VWLPNDAGPSPLRSRAKITAPVSLTLSKCVTFSYSPPWSLSRLFWFQTGHSSCCQPRAASPVMRASRSLGSRSSERQDRTPAPARQLGVRDPKGPPRCLVQSLLSRPHIRSSAAPLLAWRQRLALQTLRSETKGQAGACPDRTQAIPCTVRAVTSSIYRDASLARVAGVTLLLMTSKTHGRWPGPTVMLLR